MIEKYLVEIIYGLAFLSLVLMIIVIINAIHINKLKKRFEKMAGTDDVDLEKLLSMIRRDINDIHTANIMREDKIAKLSQELSFTINRVGFYRYNALQNQNMGRGGELSFSIAFLDSYNNGFVLTSIYAGSQSISYAKPIKNKKSSIPLSGEEELAIEMAIHGEGIK